MKGSTRDFRKPKHIEVLLILSGVPYFIALPKFWNFHIAVGRDKWLRNSESKQSVPTEGDVTIVRMGRKENSKDDDTDLITEKPQLNSSSGSLPPPPGSPLEPPLYQVDQDYQNSSVVFAHKKNKKEVTTGDHFRTEAWSSSSTGLETGDRINFSSLLESIFRVEKKTSFEPQALLERMRREKKYVKNSTWESDYQLLRCQAQPFLTRITLNGEFYDPLR